MKTYAISALVAVVAVYVAFQIPGIGPELRKQAQKPVSA